LKVNCGLTPDELLKATITTSGSTPSLTDLIVNDFRGLTLAKVLDQTMLPLLESTPKIFPTDVAATMICLNPNASRERGPSAAADDVAEA